MDIIIAAILNVLDHPAAIHAILFSLLFLSGTGIGLLPEEIVLLLGGYLAYLGFIGFFTTAAVLSVGILAADIVSYWIGFWCGEWIEKHIVAKWKFAAALTDRVKYLFERRGEKIIMFSRPLYAVRVAILMFAGHARVPFGKFLWYDALVSVPWTIAVISVSYYLSATVDVFAEASQIKHYFFMGLVLAAVVSIALRLTKTIFVRISR